MAPASTSLVEKLLGPKMAPASTSLVEKLLGFFSGAAAS
jgi:hypothetical protein